jgi:outer membrane cobalamin receptor
LFKKALGMQTGLDVSYFTNFNGNAYNPALAMFYINNNYSIGSFPFVDLFANFKIKTSKVFISVSNILGDITGVNYAQIPLYRQPTRAIRFGLQWNFVR